MTYLFSKKFPPVKWEYIVFILGLCLFSLFVVAKIYAIMDVPATPELPTQTPKEKLFSVQSIDTMKESRDMAAQILANPRAFDKMIDSRMALIANTGATHVAIDTPYDAHFIPVLKQWVASARAHGLSVWFRGNFSGWEGWFGYDRIYPNDHKNLLVFFLRDNGDLFQSGDIFTPCPECENGGYGDPRKTGDALGYQNFLSDEYVISTRMFEAMNKSITIYNSMNADVARLSISLETARKLGGVILIDHYSPSPEGFLQGIVSSSRANNALIGIGEFGAPIPDLNGKLSESDQAAFISSLLKILYERSTSTPAVNYWVLNKGSTALVDNNTPREAYFAIQNYYSAPSVYGNIYNSVGEQLDGVTVAVASTTHVFNTSGDGFYQVFLPEPYRTIDISKNGYISVTLTLPQTFASSTIQNIHLEPERMTLEYMIKKFLHALYKKTSL